VGERVCSKWKLPQALTVVIGKHHRVPSTMDDDTRQLMAILRIAERLAYTAKAGIDSGHKFDTTVDSPLLYAANMKEDVFRTLLQAVPSVIESAKAEL
jgi:HD-like signal output (HDOD) protein